MQMLYRDGRARPTPEQLQAQSKKQEEELEREVLDYRSRMQVDRSIFSRDTERRSDLHLQLSEKYMIYKDYAERALINPQNIVKGDNRVFYIRPETIFLEDPRIQNQFRNDFMKQISTPPQPEPFTVMADDIHKVILEDCQDKSVPTRLRADMLKFYKRRQYRLQHKRYKYLQRWAHFALTSELVDKVSLKFSPNYSKIQFELENAIKRHQRLEGEDHFATPDKRPQRLEANGDIVRDDAHVELIPKQSALRLDDLDVYNRIVTYEEKCSRPASKFINKAKWAPLSHRFDIYLRHQQYFQEHREEAYDKQKAYLQRVEQKGQSLIDHRKLGEIGSSELKLIVSAQATKKREKRQSLLIKEILASKAKYNYELPPMVLWNQIDLKLQLADLCVPYKINGDNMEVDNGNSFSYSIIVQFPTIFFQQVIKTQFAYVDSVPTKVNPEQLGKKNLRKVLQRNMKKYGKTTGANTLLELIDIKKAEENMSIEYINQVEKALFGQFNDGQVESIPKVRLAKSKWLDWICFKPELSIEQQQLAAFFSSERNPLDECAANMMEVVNVNDVTNTNLTLESLSQIHYEKLKHGQVKSDFLKMDRSETQQYFSEDQIEFFSIFSASLKTKSEVGFKTDENLDSEKIGKNSLFETTQHLLFAHYLLATISARESKTKLLYTLNCFRSIQKRITLDLREFGSRDRVMGDINHVKPMERQVLTKIDDMDEEAAAASGNEHVGRDSQTALSKGMASSVDISIGGGGVTTNVNDIDNIIQDEMVDINRFRYQSQMSNIIYSTCPVIPKFHTTFGEPIDRQEVSAEFEQTKDSDPKKGQAQKQLGRIDKISVDEENDCYIVTDDYGFNIMYDCSFFDMRAVEQEMLKIVSYYINKVEPMQDRDLRNVLPCVDRLGIIQEVLHWEEKFQRAKLRLCLHYMECYDHTCDTLEQQRLIQMVVELMAKRPRMNLAANHFKDSYRAEIEALETQSQIMKEFIRMQMDVEFKANNDIREILEKTYRMIYEQIDNNWQEFPKADVKEEKYKRELQTMGVGGGDATVISQLKDIEKKKPGMFQAKKHAVDPLAFAEMLGVPFSSLEMLMKQHHERDPVVKTSLHEHVSFIKIQEGYPIFVYDTAVKAQNRVHVTPESSRSIGILDFYESLSSLPKIVAAISSCQAELHQVHKPDNGYMSAALDVVILQFLHAELKAIRAEEVEGDRVSSARDLDLLTDDTILGNSDKMLFHMKELVASIEDPNLIQNPFVMTKLDLKTVDDFPFDDYQKPDKDKARSIGHLDSMDRLNSMGGSGAVLDTHGSEERSIGDVYMDGFKEESSDDDQDFEKKLQMQQQSKEHQQPRLKQKRLRVNIPSLLEVSCNAAEVVRLRGLLIDVLLQRDTLSKVYKDQMTTMAKDGRINFKDSFNFSTFLTGSVSQGRWKNFVDSGPGHKTIYPISLAIAEFDPTMLACINFSDPEAFKALLCPMGLEELRLVYRYELINLNMLIVATRTNQIILDNLQRQLSELDLLCDGYAVSNPVNTFQQNLSELNYKRLPDERRNAMFNAQAKVGPFFFNIMNRKARSRDNIEKIFQKCRQAIIAIDGQKTEVLLRQMRSCRMMLAHDYMEELTGAIILDNLRLELLHETNEMRKRAFLLPRGSMVHKLPAAMNGEHAFANYAVDESSQGGLFFDQEVGKIANFWAVPSFAEIFNLESEVAVFNSLNFKHLYQFDLGDPEAKDEYNNPIQSEFAKVNQKSLIKARLPKINYIDMMSAEAQNATGRLRIVDFQECFSFTQNRTLQQIYYLRQFQNLFDIELFANKLPSLAYSIAGLEQNVLSGLPFWDEDGPDDFDSDEYLENSETNNPMYADQSDAVESPYRNKLAQKVVARAAEEKKAKIKLLQEIEQIKEKFNEWGDHMRGLELNNDMRQAGDFLNQLVQQTYYSLVLVFMSMQDSHGEKGSAIKEMNQVREVLRVLTHRDDEKVTFTNGFHVNHAVTASSRISLDENIYRPDYDNFFKAVQPVIDEEAMNPTEFTLLSGLYLSKFTNNYSYRKNRRYLGSMPQRDYHYLDCKLINIDKDLRKYISSALIGIDSQSKHYACARLSTSDRQYIQNLNLYREVFWERKVFTKQLIRSKILRRALMVLLSKNPLPLDKVALKGLSAEFNETFSWKVMTKMDEIERQRQLAATQDQMKRQKLEAMLGDPVKAVQNVIATRKTSSKQDENILQSYDQATCEVDVYTHEIQSFMILTGKRMIERETKSLAKCFEMNGKRQQILIHPMQQFASTFDQAIDKKSHLDIVNKVDAVQKMLTQFMNRCLPIETLTSGAGYTISAKDLNECLNDLCRNIVKACEIEMRTRCEQLSMLVLQYENLLYTKDMQLLNLESKLKHAKEELNKIINTKVFSRGNNLIYELDMSTRQLRMMKDNVFLLEKGLKDKIRLYFDKDLQQTRVLLDEEKRKFKEYQHTLNAYVRENVAENINYIDEVMKKRVEAYKDVHNQADAALAEGSSHKTLNTQSMQSLHMQPAASHLMDRPNDRRKELMEKYSHLLKKGTTTTQEVGLDPFKNSDNDDSYEVIFEEMERLKESETEARNEVLDLQRFIKQSRTLQRLKEAVQTQKHDFQVDNLKQQLSSNSILWEQLAEAEKREKILKQELERCQYEIATQEKMIERLKDDVNAESREKQKLIQYKSNKSKRLDELESKAREFEVLENVNLNKLLGMMERKEKRILALERADLENTAALDRAIHNADYRVKIAVGKANQEQQVKEEAINKILEMRNRQTLLNTEDETLTADFWQGKWQEMQTSMADLREENLILHKVVHEAAQNQMTLQNQVQDLRQNGRINSSSTVQSHSMDQLEPSLGHLTMDRTHDVLTKDHGTPLDKNPYQPTTEQIQEDWNQKNNQSIRKNSMIPKILTTKTNLDSLQLLEPQKKSTVLPLIRAKESAKIKSVAMASASSGDPLSKRHRSVDPKNLGKVQVQKRLNVFQPKNAFGIGASELRYEDPSMASSSMMKDPSVKFQQMLSAPDYPVFTPNKMMSNARSHGDANLYMTSSTIRTERQRQLLSKQGFDSGPRDRNQATQVTYGTTFQLNQNSHNVFATLSSHQITSYNLSPAPIPNTLKAGSGIIMQDQSFSSGMYQQQTQAGSSNISMVRTRLPTQMSPVLAVPMMGLQAETVASLDGMNSRDDHMKKTYESLLSSKDQVMVKVNKHEQQTAGLFDSAKALVDVNSVITQGMEGPEKNSVEMGDKKKPH